MIVMEIIVRILSEKLSWKHICILLLFELALSLFIVFKISCKFFFYVFVACYLITLYMHCNLDTEIDWKAYMEEVEGFLEGERDYTKIEGNTGPLVYPAGFLYIFSILRFLTEQGTNIFRGQCIFIFVYLLNLAIVFALYSMDSSVPILSCLSLLLSKRIHSIYMLRMFNDCIAVLLGYISLLLFTRSHWKTGSLFYSLAVSVKMNLLLFAPGVLLVMLMGTNGYVETILCLSICAGVQLLVGLPFLTTYPLEYLRKSFELDRVFMHQWTVNYKFLPVEVFTGKPLSIALLALTILG